ncbi:MAG: hypothetical protein JNM82_16345, partial [Rhodocyclaceae bacterium]|nr:hypothetical protein [Rhodocyclaceae bacterium]
MKRWLWAVPVASLLLGTPLILQAKAVQPGRTAAAPNADDRFLMARDAFRAGERIRLAKAADGLAGHDLEPWARYWVLRQRIEDAEALDGPMGELMSEFLASHPGSYLAEKLRADWLRVLGRRQQWEAFGREFPALLQPEPDLVCYQIQSRLLAQDAKALDEARTLWFAAADLPESCVPVMETLAADGRL